MTEACGLALQTGRVEAAFFARTYAPSVQRVLPLWKQELAELEQSKYGRTRRSRVVRQPLPRLGHSAAGRGHDERPPARAACEYTTLEELRPMELAAATAPDTVDTAQDAAELEAEAPPADETEPAELPDTEDMAPDAEDGVPSFDDWVLRSVMFTSTMHTYIHNRRT